MVITLKIVEFLFCLVSSDFVTGLFSEILQMRFSWAKGLFRFIRQYFLSRYSLTNITAHLKLSGPHWKISRILIQADEALSMHRLFHSINFLFESVGKNVSQNNLDLGTHSSKCHFIGETIFLICNQFFDMKKYLFGFGYFSPLREKTC